MLEFAVGQGFEQIFENALISVDYFVFRLLVKRVDPVPESHEGLFF